MKKSDTAFDVRTLLGTHDEPFVIVDEDFRIVAANEAYCSTFHVDCAEIAGRLCYETVHQLEVPCFEKGEDCPFQRVFDDEMGPSSLHTHYDGHGTPRWVRVTGYKIRGTDGRQYFGESLREIAAHDPDLDRKKDGHKMVGRSQRFLELVEKLDRAAMTPAPVLLLGETGTGKELAASFIHRNSRRREGPYHCLDCTSVPESLFESEIFGHERGSFTDSIGRRKGLFELADGGTLFLDEIGEIPFAMQSKFLRVLETGEFRRVGGERSITVDVRVVCATNRHLWEGVKAGRFREDLYYRIACFCVYIPPLRERLEDIPLLVEKLIRDLQPPSPTPRLTISDAAVELLTHYNYPGNIRELRNLLQVATTLCRDGNIEVDAIHHVLKSRAGASFATEIASVQAPPAGDVHVGGNGDSCSMVGGGKTDEEVASTRSPALERLEKRYIAEILARHGGHREKTATAMGVSVRTLYRKLKRHGLE